MYLVVLFTADFVAVVPSFSSFSNLGSGVGVWILRSKMNVLLHAHGMSSDSSFPSVRTRLIGPSVTSIWAFFMTCHIMLFSCKRLSPILPLESTQSSCLDYLHQMQAFGQHIVGPSRGPTATQIVSLKRHRQLPLLVVHSAHHQLAMRRLP